MNNEQIEKLAKVFEDMGKKVKRTMAGPNWLECYFTSSLGNTIVINSDGITEVEGDYSQDDDGFSCESRFIANIEI